MKPYGPATTRAHRTVTSTLVMAWTLALAPDDTPELIEDYWK